MRHAIIAVIIAGFSVVTGCTSVEPVIATENDVTRPYEEVGALSVSKRVWGIFSHGPRGKDLREDLRELLVRKAREEYGADAVIGIEYWPDPASEYFPDGRAYARGKLIEYTAFPE